MIDYLVNIHTQRLLELGRDDGIGWELISFTHPNIRNDLRQHLSDLFVDHVSTYLVDTDQWMDGIIARIEEFVVPRSNDADVFVTDAPRQFLMAGWPIVGHTYLKQWPEQRCESCLMIQDSGGVSWKHARYCNKPGLLEGQRYHEFPPL